MRERGFFGGWGALVTSDFFLDEDRVRRAREAGCEGVYCGIESFDHDTLQAYNKRQNTCMPQVELFRRSLEHGILLAYGLILDPGTRSLAVIRREIEFICEHPEIPLPSMFTLTIPYPGTQFFKRCVEEERLLPGTKLRDLDGKTLCVRTLDPLEEAAEMVRGVQTLRGQRWNAVRSTARFVRRHARHLKTRQLAAAAARNAALMGLLQGRISVQGLWAGARGIHRTHVSTTEPLDACYVPRLPVAQRFADHFLPTMLTDAAGRVHPALAEDLLSRELVTRGG